MNPKIKNLQMIYQNNREMLKLTYNSNLNFEGPGYNFKKKEPGRKYYNEAKQVQAFCFDQWRKGKTMQQIAKILGLKSHATVSQHIKKYSKLSSPGY